MKATRSILISLGLIVCALSIAVSQTQKKIVEWTQRPLGTNNERAAPGTQLLPKLESIQIDDVATDGTSITIGQTFSAADDWLKTFVIRVKNVSEKQLASIQMTLILPDMDHASPDIVYCYGCARAEKEKGIAPGEIVDLKILGDDFYDWVKSRAAEKGGISRMNKAQIREMLVTLPDGTHWLSGCIKTTDPKNACPETAAR
jgi:hypothetical protein